MTQIAIHITSYQYTSHHTCPLLLPVATSINESRTTTKHCCVHTGDAAERGHHRLITPPHLHSDRVCMRACVRSRVNAFLRYRVRGRLECALLCMCVCVRQACVRAFAHIRRLTIQHAWPTCERSLSCVRAVCVRVFACVRCHMRGCLASALTCVRKHLVCIRGRRHTCASLAVYLSCELFPTFRLFRAATFIIHHHHNNSLGSRCVPWLGEGLSMSSPNYPVLCCPLPYRVASVFVQVVSPPLGWSPLSSYLSYGLQAVMPCPGPFHISHSVDYIYEFCPLPDTDVGPSIFVCDVEHTSFHFGLCGRRFVLC